MRQIIIYRSKIKSIMCALSAICLFPFYALLLCFLTSCNSEEDVEQPITPPQDSLRRTVLVYAVGQNDLGYSVGRESNLQSDSMEMLDGCRYLNEDEVLLLFVDDAHLPRIYKYSKGITKPEVVRQWSKDVCSSSPDVLRDVLTWTKQYFPAKEYGLVMWSHADGWLPSTNKDYTDISTRSFGIDVGSDGYMSSNKTSDYKLGAQMDINDMAEAIESSGVHPKYVFFDACLMQNIETCYDLRYATDFVVASPISIPANGANYTSQMRDGLFSEDVGAIARTYLQDVTDPLQVVDYDDFGIVFSVVNTKYMDELASIVAQSMSVSNVMKKNSIDMSDVLTYHAYSSFYHYRPHQYDARQAMRRMFAEEAYTKIEAVLNKLVVTKVSTDEFWVGPSDIDCPVDLDDYCGVAMFVPQNVYNENAQYSIHGNLNEAFRSTAWYKDAGWSVTGW